MASVAEKPVARRPSISGNWMREPLGEGQVLVPLIEDHPTTRRAPFGEAHGHGPVTGRPIVKVAIL